MNMHTASVPLNISRVHTFSQENIKINSVDNNKLKMA